MSIETLIRGSVPEFWDGIPVLVPILKKRLFPLTPATYDLNMIWMINDLGVFSALQNCLLQWQLQYIRNDNSCNVFIILRLLIQRCSRRQPRFMPQFILVTSSTPATRTIYFKRNLNFLLKPTNISYQRYSSWVTQIKSGAFWKWRPSASVLMLRNPITT